MRPVTVCLSSINLFSVFQSDYLRVLEEMEGKLQILTMGCKPFILFIHFFLGIVRVYYTYINNLNM